MNSDPGTPKLRVALFGSYYTGYETLRALLGLAEELPLELVGVVTDDPSQVWSNARVRFWKHGYSEAEATLVARLAAEHGLPVWTGRIKPRLRRGRVVHDSRFPERMRDEWRPDVVYMAAFGQRIHRPLIDTPRFGFFNIHTSRVEALSDWPKFAGADGFSDVISAGVSSVNVVLHEVVEEIDAGPAVCFSPPVRLFLDPESEVEPPLQVMQACARPAGMLVASHCVASVLPQLRAAQPL